MASEIYFGPGVATSSATPGERRDVYVISRDEIDFNNATMTEPSVDIEATHEVSSRLKGERFLITLRANGIATQRTRLSFRM